MNASALPLRQDLLDNQKFKDPGKRKENQSELRNLIEKIIKTQTAEYWEEKFNDYAVPAARVRNLDEILDER